RNSFTRGAVIVASRNFRLASRSASNAPRRLALVCTRTPSVRGREVALVNFVITCGRPSLVSVKSLLARFGTRSPCLSRTVTASMTSFALVCGEAAGAVLLCAKLGQASSGAAQSVAIWEILRSIVIEESRCIFSLDAIWRNWRKAKKTARGGLLGVVSASGQFWIICVDASVLAAGAVLT